MTSIKEKREEILINPHKLGWWLGYGLLNEVHGSWIKKTWGGNHDRDYLLLAHRNSFKTTSIVIVGVVWYLLFNPNASILLVRKSAEASQALMALIRNLYRTEKMRYLYQAMGLGKGFFLREDKKNRLILSTAKHKRPEANVEVISVGTKGVTGRHYDRIHLDDVVDEVDMNSQKEREGTKLFYHNLKSVIMPGQCITATGTPWHCNDLYSLFTNVDRYPIGSVDIPFFSEDELQKIKSVLPPYQFSSQYDLSFSDNEKLLFREPVMTSEWMEQVPVYGHVDCAYGGGDFNALTIIQLTSNGVVNVLGKLFRGHIVNHYDDIGREVEKYDVKGLYLEENFDKGLVAKDLRAQGIPVWSYQETVSKYAKITSILYRYWSVLRFSKNCDAGYLQQITEYRNGVANDDAPDSLASLLMQLNWRLEADVYSSHKPYVIKEEIKKWLSLIPRRALS